VGDAAALRHGSVESAASWLVALASLVIIATGFGSPYLVAVGLTAIAGELEAPRWVPSLATSLLYIGCGFGGLGMGFAADRLGAMPVAALGSAMIGVGAVIASRGGALELYLGYGLFIGLLGTSAIFAPLMANASRWFDRRRGSALALVASGQQVAGFLWPPLFRYAIERIGWRGALLWYGVFVIATMPLVSLCLYRRPPPAAGAAAAGSARPLTLAPGLTQAALCLAIVCCCVPMAMPLSQLVAFCGDLGYAPARGAEMLSLLLLVAFLSRGLWGRLGDRLGGLRTVLIGSFCQTLFLAFYLWVSDLGGLYVVSAAFGLGFAGIIPSYVLAVRDLFPASEAGWRIAAVLLFGLNGMALGAWLGGYLYDLFGWYQPAFALGVAVNLVNLALIGALAHWAMPARRTARTPLPS
jgi:MFS family permease